MAGAGIGVSQRVAAATIAEWSKEVSEQTVQRYILLSMLQKKGRIKYGCNGGESRWVFRYRDHTLRGFPDNVPLSFTKETTIKNANLPWRGYYVADSITHQEKLEQGGDSAMIKIFEGRSELMRRGAIRQLAPEFFVDGNSAAAVANNSFHGIESMMGIAAQTSSDHLATTHDDSYAGQSTAVNALGTGESSNVWTPVIVNTDYDPGDGTRSWANYADEHVRFGLIESTYSPSKEDNTDLILLTKSAYNDYLNILDDKERLNIKRGESIATAKMGFDKFVEQDGCVIGWDLAVPTTDSDSMTVRGYGFNTDRMKLKVLGPKKSKNLFDSRVTFNDDYQADRVVLRLLGNLCFESPRHFTKFADISSVAS